MMYPTAPMALDAWADVDAAIAAARQSRQDKIERLSTLSSLVILAGAIWLMWPNLQSAFKGDSGLFQGLGYPLLIIAYGLILQDSVLDNPQARTRIGSFACIAWPVLMMIASKHLEVQETTSLIGCGFVLVVAYTCFSVSGNILQGGLDVLLSLIHI